jgi:hypothetical protein
MLLYKNEIVYNVIALKLVKILQNETKLFLEIILKIFSNSFDPRTLKLRTKEILSLCEDTKITYLIKAIVESNIIASKKDLDFFEEVLNENISQGNVDKIYIYCNQNAKNNDFSDEIKKFSLINPHIIVKIDDKMSDSEYILRHNSQFINNTFNYKINSCIDHIFSSL